MKNKNLVINDDFESILICAVRYSIGRRTYMPSTVIRYITPLLSSLSSTTLFCMKRDVEEAEKENRLGDENIDKPLWISFKEKIEETILEKGKTRR